MGTSLVFLDTILYYILAANKILGAIKKGLAKVIGNAQIKKFVQVTLF